MLLFVLPGFLLQFATRQLFALLGENAKRPKRVFYTVHKFPFSRTDASTTQEFVQLLLRAALPVGRYLDEFKCHLSHLLFFQDIARAGASSLLPLYGFLLIKIHHSKLIIFLPLTS